MVAGAEVCCDAKSSFLPPADAGVSSPGAVVVPLFGVVSALNAGELAALVTRGLGSKGGRSIMLPAVGKTWLMVSGVINWRF
jgi:hypothetical protein